MAFYDNITPLQKLWREDEIVYTTLFTVNGILPFRQVLPFSLSQSAKENIIKNANTKRQAYAKATHKQLMDFNETDLVVANEENGFAHLYIQSMDQAFKGTIRYAKLARTSKNGDVLFYVGKESCNTFRNVEYLVFINKHDYTRYLVKAKDFCDDMIGAFGKDIKEDAFNLDYLKEHNYLLATWTNHNGYCKVEYCGKTITCNAKNLKNKMFEKFDRAQICGRRDTSRAFKAYKNGYVAEAEYLTSLTKFSEKFCENYGGDVEKTASKLRTSLNRTRDKLKKFRETGKASRTSTFLGSDFYVFDNLWTDEEILAYMKQIEDKATAKKEAEEKKLVEENNKKYIEENYDPEDSLGLNWWIDKVTNTEEETTWKDTSNKTKVTFAGTQLPPLQRQKSCLAL